MAISPARDGTWAVCGLSFDPYDIRDKHTGVHDYMDYMLDRTNMMFEWHNLPDTIPDYMLELMLQTFGVIAISEYSGDSSYPHGLYALRGGLGDFPDPYYRPTKYIGANPALKWEYKLEIGKECVVVKNDTRMRGLIPLFRRYSTQMVENDISIRSAQINSRQQTVISAQTDREAASATEYMRDLEAGKLSVVAERALTEGIKVHNAGTTSTNNIIQLIELQQYLKASWYNEIGLNTAFNMKREYVSAEELAANTDILLPLVDDMLRCRKDAVEKINALYGTNIEVERNSAWANKYEESIREGEGSSIVDDNRGREQSDTSSSDA